MPSRLRQMTGPVAGTVQESAAPANRPKPTPKVYDFITQWLNQDRNRLVLTEGGDVFQDLVIHLQRAQAGARDLTPDKLEAYHDIIELINQVRAKFPPRSTT